MDPQPSPETVSAAAARIMARCAELRGISASPSAYERLYLTREHRTAAERIMRWMEDAGLAARMDAVGNVIGRREGANAQVACARSGLALRHGARRRDL